MEDFTSAANFHGSVLVADRQGKVIFEAAYGLANDAAKVPFLVDTAVDIGSNSKAYAAVAVLTLVRDGHLSLDHRLPQYFPDVPADKSEITIHQLLTHSSGLPDEYDRSYETTTREIMEKSILAQPLLFKPGQDFSYSDMGYALLHALIERVSGLAYQKYVERFVFTPYGLTNTGFLESPMWDFNGGNAPVARGYTNGEERDSPITLPKDTWMPIGGGTILSTVKDGVKWHSGLVAGRVLGNDLSAMIFSRHREIRKHKSWYGYGWGIVNSPTRGTVYAHSGATASHNYYSQFLADHGLFVITASNRIDGSYDDKNQNGSIEDDEIINETIYAIDIGIALAKALSAK